MTNKAVTNNPYDEMPYISHAFPASLPNHLEAIATLFNLNPSSSKKARILELGCASGGNIIPLALYNPALAIVGIDYSKVQIEEGAALIKALGLKNIELKQMDLGSITKDLGIFDYIICHGVYSWVPKAIQDAILRVCHENLADEGVAYISYNTYPGWKINEIARDAMMFHTRDVASVQDQVTHGCNMLGYLNNVAPKDSIFKNILNHQLELFSKTSAYYLAHEYLEAHNAPCYFKDFVKHAEENGLVYLAESEISPMFATNLLEEQRNQLAIASQQNQVNLEQYLDFVYNRTFRQTLLCKAKHAKEILYNIAPEILKKLAFTTELRVAQGDELKELPANTKKYISTQNAESWVSVTGDSGIAFLDYLITQHAPISYQNIITALKKTTNLKEINEADLLKLIYNLLITNRLTAFAHEIDVKREPSNLKMDPKMVQYGLQKGFLVSPLHKEFIVDPFIRALIPLLNGEDDIAALQSKLFKAATEQQFTFTNTDNNTIIEDEAAIQTLINNHLPVILNLFRTHGLL